jgi:hypothetical protein
MEISCSSSLLAQPWGTDTDILAICGAQQRFAAVGLSMVYPILS